MSTDNLVKSVGAVVASQLLPSGNAIEKGLKDLKKIIIFSVISAMLTVLAIFSISIVLYRVLTLNDFTSLESSLIVTIFYFIILIASVSYLFFKEKKLKKNIQKIDSSSKQNIEEITSIVNYFINGLSKDSGPKQTKQQ